ncbi:sulfurtransferase [Paenibacillus sp. NPDC058071]|uniref:sulfurtransferase n=1 Tax=Paenibacillus sp. NPDC058071 TaxID=3346326 RepID=UPI0036DA17AC
MSGYYQTTEWLKEQMAAGAPLIIVDARYQLMDSAAGKLAYDEGHVPGAQYASLSKDLSGPKRENGEGGRHPLPEPETLAATFGKMGIGQKTTVIAYDNEGDAYASRLLWLLKWAGHEAEAYILAGGYSEWLASGGEVTKEVPVVEFAVFTPSVTEGIVVDAAYVRERIGLDGVTIIDSRDGARYRGEVEPIDKAAGHVPSAINRFWKDGFDENGLLKPIEQQRERFANLSPDDEIIVYCGSGVTATPNVLVLEAAGFKNVKLYAGSWSDWSSDEGNAVAVGDE